MSLNNLSLGVVVVGVYDLKPKDRQGSSSVYVELFFEGQRYQTTIKDEGCSPFWDESFYFSISDPNTLQNLNLEAYVYGTIRGGNDRSLLGKVSVSGASFVPHSDAVILQYPLKKRRIFSRARGEIRLKVYITDAVPSINSSTLLPSVDDSGISMHAEVTRTLHHDHSPGLEVSYHSPKCEIEEVRSEEMEADTDTPPPEAQSFDSTTTCDLVERMYFLYVTVVKARVLPIVDIPGSLDPSVEVRVGKYKGVLTERVEKDQDPEWNVVFAFSKDRMRANELYVEVKVKKHCVGVVRFDLKTVPMRVPTDSPLAPQWYRLEGDMGELMLAVWAGTQADEAFLKAYHFDDGFPIMDLSTATRAQLRPKIYFAPRLGYVRVTVIEAQELQPKDRTRFPKVYVKAQMDNQIMITRTVETQTLCPLWNEDLFFVAAEPYEGHIVVAVKNNLPEGEKEILGSVTIPLIDFYKRADDRATPSQWYDLENQPATDVDRLKKENFSSRLHLELCIEEGYHVLDESPLHISDLHATATHLRKTPIGVLEVAILGADHLSLRKTRGGRKTLDTYCVAKYAGKWVRTRTIIDRICPRYNEQYTWEVFDRATVLCLGVFDNMKIDGKGSNDNEDLKIGKVEIRVSAIKIDVVNIKSLPLFNLEPTGVEIVGMLHMAIRFTCTSFANLYNQYSRPLLPKMHYVRPIRIEQQEILRLRAVAMVAMRFGMAEPALGKEVVEYMCEVKSNLWSMRRTKGNFVRIMTILRGPVARYRYFGNVCLWRNPITTVLFHILFLMLVYFPVLIMPAVFLYVFLNVTWRFRYRRFIINTAPTVACHPDELDEELNTFPTSISGDLVRMRYDRLRSISGTFQTIFGIIATHGERLLALFRWYDTFASGIFATFCLMAAVVLYVTPLKVVVALAGLYVMRHPRFRSPMPELPFNFFSRLPANEGFL